MGAVGVEESAAVGTEFLDHFLGRYRPLRDHLLCNRLCRGFAVGPCDLRRVRLDQIDGRVRFQVLYDTFGYKDQRTD